MNLKRASGVVALLGLAVACGAADPSTSTATEAVAGSVSPWSRVTETTGCEPLQPSECPGAYGFSIDSTGHFVAGPNPAGATASGRIGSEELAQLDSTIATIVPMPRGAVTNPAVITG